MHREFVIHRVVNKYCFMLCPFEFYCVSAATRSDTVTIKNIINFYGYIDRFLFITRRALMPRPTESTFIDFVKGSDKMLIPGDNVKHPLQNEWSFWMNTNRAKNWEANIIELTSFNTVEDYWCLYHHMKVPSELKLGQDYMVFKKGIQPMWEDKANKNGGRWLLMLDRVKTVPMDSIWSDVVLLLIGETFEHSDEITGVVVNVRDKHKVSVWMRTTKRQAVMEIGMRLKMQFRIQCRIHYYKHNSSASMYSF